MNDRELLELAAKAAGIDGQYFESENGICIHTGIYRPGLDYYWNPLLSASEALWLAVTLRIEIAPEGFSAGRTDARPRLGKWLWEMHSDHAGDPHSATRRAITRAAAEIGRSIS